MFLLLFSEKRSELHNSLLSSPFWKQPFFLNFPQAFIFVIPAHGNRSEKWQYEVTKLYSQKQITQENEGWRNFKKGRLKNTESIYLLKFSARISANKNANAKATLILQKLFVSTKNSYFSPKSSLKEIPHPKCSFPLEFCIQCTWGT